MGIFKRLKAAATAAVMLAFFGMVGMNAVGTVSADEITKAYKGDMDRNGAVNSIDVSIMSDYIMGLAVFDENDLAVADMNGDKKVNVYDFVLVKRTVLGERALQEVGDAVIVEPTAPTEPTTAPTDEPVVTTTVTAADPTETPTTTVTTVTTKLTTPEDTVCSLSFTDIVKEKGEDYIVFAEHGRFTYLGNYYDSDEQRNLSNYDPGDKISITLSYLEYTNVIIDVREITLIENVRTEATTTTAVETTTTSTTTTAAATSVSAEPITLADMPSNYTYAADWIWENRVLNEKSTERRNTIFDQIVAGNGTLNYVVKWQSYKKVTLEQRKQFEVMLEKAVNDWTDWLVGYENWPYDHVNVKVVGWAVIDESVLLDRQPDEVVYSDTTFYDSTYDQPEPGLTIPNVVADAPSELSRADHFWDANYQYPGGYENRFDMVMWATEGFPNIGGCGGDWGQRLSDTAYLAMLNGTNLHVLEHELGHGFGMTDFYGGEGEKDGFPPGGFPGGENSLMMAGSAMKITDFDGWELRYFWSKIKDEPGRFNGLK